MRPTDIYIYKTIAIPEPYQTITDIFNNGNNILMINLSNVL